MSQTLYVGGVDMLNLHHAVSRLAPKCSDCGQKQLHICAENCCSTEPLYCQQCNADRHLTHRTNQLPLLFINKVNVMDIEKCRLNLSSIKALLIKDRQLSQKVIDRQLRLIDVYNRQIATIEKELERLTRGVGYESCYEATRKLLAGQGHPGELRHQFQKSIAELDLSFFLEKTPDLQTLFDELKLNSAFLQPNSDSSKTEKYQALLQSLNPKFNLCKMIRDTAIELQPKPLEMTGLTFIDSLRRWKCIPYIDKMPQFRGERLKITTSATLPRQQLDTFVECNLISTKELITRDLFTAYPQCLVWLSITLDYVPFDPNFVSKLPKQLKSLFIKVPVSSSHTFFYYPYTRSRTASNHTYIADVQKLEKLEKLKLCFEGVASEKTLLKWSVNRKLSYFSLTKYDQSVPSGFFYSKGEQEQLSDTIKQLNNERRGRIMQLVRLLRTSHLRKTSRIFIDELINWLEGPSASD